ncbi:MAG: hypothetical protein IPI00_15440 [Flavobacteriales bacterium]|nr:hypothetical protein [Flavobacteriales bacterium]MBK9535040.1 hypothetical protein [Flavobacteriales bacterium]HQX30613.1 hypothetical protein [Flavobacteriales bacterium]
MLPRKASGRAFRSKSSPEYRLRAFHCNRSRGIRHYFAIMKYQSLVLLLLFVTCTLTTSAQKLDEDKVDEFTKVAIKRTTWEKFVGGGGMATLSTHIRLSKLNERVVIELKMIRSNTVYSIDESANLMFLFANGDVVTLHNNEFALTCSGCGATGFVGSTGMGTHTRYPIGEEDIAKMSKDTIAKVRIYTNDGYIERDVSNKESAMVQKMLALVTQ